MNVRFADPELSSWGVQFAKRVLTIIWRRRQIKWGNKETATLLRVSFGSFHLVHIAFEIGFSIGDLVSRDIHRGTLFY
jgi:hypothetical protein